MSTAKDVTGARTGTVLSGHGGSVTGVAFRADGQVLTTSGSDMSVRFR